MIKIVSGFCNVPVLQKNGGIRYELKGAKDGPLSLPAELEARLVRRGAAVYVSEEIPADLPNEPAGGYDGTPIGFEDVPPEDYTPEEPAEAEKPLEEMSAKELHAMGEEMGLTFKHNASKVHMIAAIREVLEDTEDGPVFDASEAVM